MYHIHPLPSYSYNQYFRSHLLPCKACKHWTYLPKSCSDRKQRQSSVRIISRSPSLPQRWICLALSVVAPVAVSVREAAGLRFSAAVWCIRRCSEVAVLIPMNTVALLSVSVLKDLLCSASILTICVFFTKTT